MKHASKTIRRTALAGFAALMVFAAVAVGAVETKEEYKALVEPICKKNKQESDRLLKGVKDLVKRDKLKTAGEKFAKAANALERTQKELAAVEQPPAYASKLTKWLSEIKAEVSLMRKISAKFKAGNKSKATSLAVTLQNNANRANNGVVIFQFNYCKIDPSKYT